MAVDLSKAYYSRDEVMRAIESLKDRYLKESASPSAAALEAAVATKNTTVVAAAQPPTIGHSATRLANSTIVRDIECLNGKLAELQAEISRLTLLQQRQQQQQQQQNVKNNSNRTSMVFNVDNNAANKESTPESDGLSQQPGRNPTILQLITLILNRLYSFFYSFTRWIVFHLVRVGNCQTRETVVVDAQEESYFH